MPTKLGSATSVLAQLTLLQKVLIVGQCVNAINNNIAGNNKSHALKLCLLGAVFDMVYARKAEGRW